MFGICKRSFPDDWSNLKDGQVAENIQYLLSHCYDSDVKCFKDDRTNSVCVDNVKIMPNILNKYSYIINNKEITKDKNEYIYYKIVLLYDLGKMCATYTDTEKNKVIIRYVKILLVGVGLMLASQIFHKIKQDKQPIKQEINPMKQEQLKQKTDVLWIDCQQKKCFMAQNIHTK